MKFKVLISLAVLSVAYTGSAFAQVSTCSQVGSSVVHPGAGNVCWTQPDVYETTIYEIALCNAAPTAPTSSLTLGTSSCSTIFSSASGATVQITGGVGTPPSGIFTRPPNDTYTHGYVIVDKDFNIESSITFTGAVTADGGGTNANCVTLNASTTAPPTANCGAVLTAGTLAVATNDFDGGAGFSPSTTATFTGASGGTVAMNAYLVDSSANLASASGAVQRIVAVQTFASPVIVTSSSTSFNMAINTSNGMTVIDTAGVTSLDNGPFRVELSVF